MGDLETVQANWDNYVVEKKELQHNLEQEKNKRMAEVNRLERDKIQATEKLRKEMLVKIKETKANLLALNDE